jgi:hypothetical protein
VPFPWFEGAGDQCDGVKEGIAAFEEPGAAGLLPHRGKAIKIYSILVFPVVRLSWTTPNLAIFGEQIFRSPFETDFDAWDERRQRFTSMSKNEKFAIAMISA